jgi:hypothetical protein
MGPPLAEVAAIVVQTEQSTEVHGHVGHAALVVNYILQNPCVARLSIFPIGINN